LTVGIQLTVISSCCGKNRKIINFWDDKSWKKTRWEERRRRSAFVPKQSITENLSIEGKKRKKILVPL
jgi:hypothetical protein